MEKTANILSCEEKEVLAYLKNLKKTRDQSIFLSEDFSRLIFKPKDEYRDPAPELPILIKHFITLYERAKTSPNKGIPVKLFFPKNIYLKILSTEGGGIKRYQLVIENEVHIIDDKTKGRPPFEVLRKLRESPFLEKSFEPPSIPQVFTYSHIWTLEKLEPHVMILTFQEGFVFQHLLIQFDWMEGEVLIPSVNSGCFGYRFFVDDPKLLSAFEILFRLYKTLGSFSQILKEV